MEIEIPAEIIDFENQKSQKMSYYFTDKDIQHVRLLRTLIKKGLKVIDSEKYPNLSKWFLKQENDFVIVLLKKYNELSKTA
jgi:hypothetical protein